MIVRGVCAEVDQRRLPLGIIGDEQGRLRGSTHQAATCAVKFLGPSRAAIAGYEHDELVAIVGVAAGISPPENGSIVLATIGDAPPPDRGAAKMG